MAKMTVRNEILRKTKYIISFRVDFGVANDDSGHMYASVASLTTQITEKNGKNGKKWET